MEVEIIHERQEGVKVTIDCPKTDKTAEDLKRHIEQYDNRIKGYQNGEICMVDIKDIYYIETVDSKTFAYMRERVLEIRFRIYELEELLSEKEFIRTSKSQIVNIRKMKALSPQMNRTILVTMDNDECLQISRRYVKDLKQRLGI